MDALDTVRSWSALALAGSRSYWPSGAAGSAAFTALQLAAITHLPASRFAFRDPFPPRLLAVWIGFRRPNGQI